MHLLVDSTGLKLCGAGEWLLGKHGTKTRRAWRALVEADVSRFKWVIGDGLRSRTDRRLFAASAGFLG